MRSCCERTLGALPHSFLVVKDGVMDHFHERRGWAGEDSGYGGIQVVAAAAGDHQVFPFGWWRRGTRVVLHLLIRCVAADVPSLAAFLVKGEALVGAG